MAVYEFPLGFPTKFNEKLPVTSPGNPGKVEYVTVEPGSRENCVSVKFGKKNAVTLLAFQVPTTESTAVTAKY